MSSKSHGKTRLRFLAILLILLVGVAVPAGGALAGLPTSAPPQQISDPNAPPVDKGNMASDPAPVGPGAAVPAFTSSDIAATDKSAANNGPVRGPAGQKPQPAAPQQPKAPLATCTSLGTGNWNTAGTWSCGFVPTAADDVIIANGHTVTIDTTAVALNVTVGQGTSGILQYDPAVANSLAVGQSVTVAAGGTFQANPAGAFNHTLSIGGNLINNGAIDFSQNGNTSQVAVTFTDAAGTLWSGNGSTNLKAAAGVTLNKGTSALSALDFTPGTGAFTVEGANTSGFLTITNGSFRIVGSNAFSNPVFTAAAYTIPATGGFTVNNVSATVVGQNGSPINNGSLVLQGGTYNIGTVGTNVMGAGAGASFAITGGTMNVAGRLNSASTFITYTQLGGVVNICVTGGCATAPSFGFTGATGVVTKFSGGTINLVQANTAATPVDYNETGTMAYTGGTLNIGTAATATNFVFRVQGQMPAVVIDNTTNNKTANLSGQGNVWGNLTINTGTTLNLNPGTAQTLLMIGPTLTNNGAIIVNTNNTSTVNFAGALQPLGTPYTQTYTGTGTFGATALRVNSFSLQNPLGVTINATVSALNIYRINAFYGMITNSNLLAIGAGDAVALVIQRGATGIAFTAGSLDVAPTFNIGTGGLTLVYAQSQTTLTTGPEIPPTRSVNSIQILNPTGVTLAGGALTAINTASALLLSAGTLNTSAANLLTLTGAAAGAVSGGSAATWVNGPLARTLPASLLTGSTYTFPVGKGSFKMLELVNPTTNAGGTVVIQAEVFDADSGGTGGVGFSDINHNRYWFAQITSGAANFTNTTVRLTEQGTVAANSIGQSATQTGAYDSIGGAVSGAVIGPSTTAITLLGYFAVGKITGAPTISGAFTVGTGGIYTTLTAAVTDLNSKLMTGPVTFQLTDNTYAAETYPITINPNGGNSATNTLTIKPFTGATPAFSGTSATALIVINGFDYVTIDGSNTTGGTSRDMTLTNNSTGITSAVIWGQTIGTADPTTNNTIKNLNVIGNASTTTLVGVGFGSSTIGTASLGTRNDNNRVQNNNINTLQFGVYSQGASSIAKNLSTIVTGNLLGGAGAAALGRAGVFIGFDDGVQITNNNIAGVSSATSSDNFGIALGSISVSVTAFTTNDDVANATVTGNFVGPVIASSTTGFSAVGISLGTTNYGTSRIANNSIFGVTAPSTSPDFVAGMFIGSAGTTFATTQIYFNSVSLTGLRDTTTLATIPSFALAILGANPLSDVRNNSLYNTQTAANGGVGGAAGSYAIGLTSIGIYVSLTSNYNDLYSSGPSSHFSTVGSLVNVLGDRPSLAAWQAETGKDANSISADPLYTSTTNLQPLAGSPLFGAGQTIAGITTDILGFTRNNPPSIGAYEYPVGGPTATSTAAPPTATNTAIPPTATNTAVPPTATRTNTAVPPTNTNTAVPPTSTNTAVASTATASATSCPFGPATYSITSATGVIVPATTNIGNSCDDCTTNITFPFPITVYGNTFTSALASSNGQIDFGTGDTSFTNACLPNPVIPTVTSIYPYWDDQRTDANTGCAAFPSGCGIFTSQVGSAFYVEWRTVLFSNTSIAENYELVFTAGSPNFSIVYGTLITDTASETIGVQQNATNFTQYKCNTSGGAITPGLQLNFTLGCPSPTPTSTNTPVAATATATATATCTLTPNYGITASTGATMVPANNYVPGSTCNSCTVNITLPFTYSLYDTPYTSVNASNKGNLQFTTNSTTGANTCLPAAVLGDSIMPYWDDQNTNINDTMGIYTSITGVAPNRIFNIRWYTGVEGVTAPRSNYEVRLYEGLPKFEMIYGTVTQQGSSATIGVQKADGTRLTQWSCNTAGSVQSGYRLVYDRACPPSFGGVRP